MPFGAIVTTEWLSDHLDDPRLRIIDIRGKVLSASMPPPHYISHRSDYDVSHIPGAIFVDWTQDIVEPGSPSGDVLNPDDYAALMSRLGIGADSIVVAYDDASGMLASRFWWALSYYGHEAAAVLDGGWPKWVAENRPITSLVPDVVPGVFEPRLNPQLRIAAQEILAQSAGLQLIDVRTPQEYAGEASRARRAGHIPGALNVPRSALVSKDGTMPAPEALKEILARYGVSTEAEETVFYCNSGVSASYVLLAFAHAGYGLGRLYDGSWKDWGNDDSLPLALD